MCRVLLLSQGSRACVGAQAGAGLPLRAEGQQRARREKTPKGASSEWERRERAQEWKKEIRSWVSPHVREKLEVL